MRNAFARTLALVAVLSLVAMACGSDEPEPASGGGEDPAALIVETERKVRLVVRIADVRRVDVGLLELPEELDAVRVAVVLEEQLALAGRRAAD